MKKVLHVGCGPYKQEKLPKRFDREIWWEVRLDIDPLVKPDVVASITDLGGIQSGCMDAVYSSHNIEHLYPHEVDAALKEFARVLKPDGFALVTCPDLQSIAGFVADDRLEDPIYESPAGPVAPLDVLYGFRPSLARGNLFMAHRTGFTANTLGKALVRSGFAKARVNRDRQHYNLWALGLKEEALS